MSYLYGDSTTFPYDVDYIELSRHAVECAMQLLSAQHAIVSALAREEAQNQQRNVERTRLSTMSEALESALAPYLDGDSETAAQAASRTLRAAKACLEDERAEEERRAAEAASHAQHVVQRASETAHRALEAFLVRHDLPETELGLTLHCNGEQTYVGDISIRSPFGICATFALRGSSEHPWSRPRRVADLVGGGVEIHLPQPSGWISRRVEMAPVKLERMFVSGVRVAGAELELTLRKAASSGSGYRVQIDLRGEKGALLTPLDENGQADAEPPLALDGEDAARMLDLGHRVVDSVQGLTALRASMNSVSLDDQPLEQLQWPETVAHRLLAQLAPIVLEMSRRSGAPGELVLRRDVGGGRREELYVTKSELWERLLVLPPERRAVFETLGLNPPVPVAALEAPASAVQQKPLYERAARAVAVSAGPAA